MPLSELRMLPDDLVSRVDPARVLQHVRATGWAYEPRLSDKSAIYQRPDSDLEQIIIPLSHHLRDFTPRMAEAVGFIAEWEKRPALELLYELLLPAGDLIFFRESGPAVGRIDVPLDLGLDLLSGIRKLLLAAACSVIRPEPFHPRTSLPDAEEFLDRCRFAHTRQDGFTITVACPVGPEPGTDGPFETPPFARRVTDLLMRSLHRLVLSLESADWRPPLKSQPREPEVSANLCDALLDMTPVGEDASLTISASRARTLPLPDGGGPPDQVLIRQEWFRRIETLAVHLRPAPALRRQVFVGFVDTLDGRPNPQGQREGVVVLRAILPEGELIRARVELNATDHHTAWEAYDQDQPVRVDGVLRRVGKTYRIDNVTSFRVLEEEPAAQPQTT